MKNEIKSGLIALLMTVIGFVAGLATMDAIIILDKKSLNTATELHKIWAASR